MTTHNGKENRQQEITEMRESLNDLLASINGIYKHAGVLKNEMDEEMGYSC